MTLTLDDILCTRCSHNLGFDTHCQSFVVDCNVAGYLTGPKVICGGFEEKPHECEKCSPINIGWCTGDCKKCHSRTEWQEWAE